jgi:photosystem II stability/assembly factor-like uncharacterized protein
MKIYNGLILYLTLCLTACINSKSKEKISTSTSVGSIALTSQSHQNAVAVVYNSTDGGKTWQAFDSGIPSDATISAFLVQDDKIFASTDYHGLYFIKGMERHWKRIDEDLPKSIDINTIIASGNTVVIGTLAHGIMISRNGGKNWESAAVQINTPVRSLHKMANLLFAGGDNGIYKSADEGKTWTQLYKGVQVNGFTELNNKIYAAVMNGAMTSDDNYVNWKYVYKPNTLHDISNDGERLYAMTLGNGLQRSDNTGLTWNRINNGLGTLNLYTFELKNFGTMIFAAQWYGIYRSENFGNSWSIIKSGLPDSTAFTTLEATRNGLIAGIGLRKK